MPSDEYKKKVQQWAEQQARTEIRKTEEKPYNVGRMKVRAPLGCLAIGAMAILFGVYWLVVNGFFKHFLNW